MVKARFRLIKRKKRTSKPNKKKHVSKHTKSLRFRSRFTKTKKIRTRNPFYHTIVNHWISGSYPIYTNPTGNSYSFDLNNLVHNVDWRINPENLFDSAEFKNLAKQYSFFKLVKYRISYTSQAVYNQISLGLPRLYAVLDTKTYTTQRSKCFSDVAHSWQPISYDPKPLTYTETFPNIHDYFRPFTSCWLSTSALMSQQGAPYFILGIGSIEDVLSTEKVPIGSIRIDVSVKFCRPYTNTDNQSLSRLSISKTRSKLDMTPLKNNLHIEDSRFKSCEII